MRGIELLSLMDDLANFSAALPFRATAVASPLRLGKSAKSAIQISVAARSPCPLFDGHSSLITIKARFSYPHRQALQQSERRDPQAQWQHKETLMKYTFITMSIILMTNAGTCLGADPSICSTGEITYFAKGQVSSCTLKDDFTVNGVKCKQYAPINFYPNGALKSCVSSDFFIYGSIICNQYGRVSFYRSGKLDTCDLSKSIEIDGKTCAQFESITLFENGKLKSCSRPH
ncbi:hypothetical protein [Geomonas sp. Red276]